MSPSPDTLPDRPLAESIAVATRSSHTRLNKSIIARLPMVTRASDPSSYITGLLHIAPIYLTIEASWDALLGTTQSNDETSEVDSRDPADILTDHGLTPTPAAQSALQLRKPVVCDRLRTLLQQLRLPGLMRSNRLRADIRALTGWSEHILDDQLRLTGESGHLGEFTAHIKRSIEHRPHVLIAYSYILYMALFAGGRFIRATLQSAGDEFWNAVPSPVKPSMLQCNRGFSSQDESLLQGTEEEVSPTTGDSDHEHGTPLSFFHFATPEDGEDLKREFKGRLSDAEELLTRHEICDIVQESICIFDSMELLVKQLDNVCAEDDGKDNTSSMENLSALMGKSMAMRLRDSVAVTKDRAARSSSRMSSSSDSDSFSAFVKPKKGHFMNATTTTTRLSSDGVPGHPLVPATIGATELCPALKSMRFDSTLPSSGRAAAEATEGIKGVHYTNWLLMAAFSVIIIGAVMTTRREMIMA